MRTKKRIKIYSKTFSLIIWFISASSDPPLCCHPLPIPLRSQLLWQWLRHLHLPQGIVMRHLMPWSCVIYKNASFDNLSQGNVCLQACRYINASFIDLLHWRIHQLYFPQGRYGLFIDLLNLWMHRPQLPQGRDVSFIDLLNLWMHRL